MRNLPGMLIVSLLFSFSLVFSTESMSAPSYRIVEALEIDTVPSWFPVGFCLLTHGEQQYVAYYNEQHQMVVAQRGLGEQLWRKIELPSKVGWDSHNYITMAIDAAGYVHLAGNMHCVPLVYFRTKSPGDVATFERHTMTGQDEQRCTYPKFLENADGQLLFTYRSGGSGNGRRFYNLYEVSTNKWTRFLDTPLFDGEDKRNAYPLGPIKGPDGLFHVVWVWRDTPDCATNHHLSYARSRNLKDWETAAGTAVELPLTIGQTALCVDPIPPGGGIINGCERLIFDSAGHPIISYHKLDENGHMQIYVTRFQNEQWRGHPVTDWQQNITFSGRGAMPFIGIRISGLRRLEPAMFRITYRHRDYGSGDIILDEESLHPVRREIKVPVDYPPELTIPSIDFEGVHVRLADDLGPGSEELPKYVLRWETLEAHQDQPRSPPLPPASTLQLITLQRAAE